MDEAMTAIIFLLILGVIGVVIYLTVSFNKYKDTDGERAEREKQARLENINYVIDETNVKNQDIYNELKDQINRTQENVNAYNQAIQFGPVSTGGGPLASGGSTGSGVTTTGLASQSTTASGGRSVTSVGGRVPDVNILGKVNAVNGLTTTDFNADGSISLKNKKAAAVVKMEGPAGTGSIDVAAGGGLMNITSGASYRDNRWVYDGNRNSTRMLLHDNVITLNTPTSTPSKDTQVSYKEQVRVHNDGMNVQDHAWVGGTVHSRNNMIWNPDWGWYHAYRSPNDQIFFGADNVNRGVWSGGPRPVSVYTDGKSRLSVANDGMVRVNRSEADKYPANWSRQGLHAFDVYASATIAAGKDGKVQSWMQNDGHVLSGDDHYQWKSLLAPWGGVLTRDPNNKVTSWMHWNQHGVGTKEWTPNAWLDWTGNVVAGKDGQYKALMEGASGNVFARGNYILTGQSKYIMHAPQDGRRSLHIAPNTGLGEGEWNWDFNKGLVLDAAANKTISKGDFCVRDTCITEDQLKKIKTATGA